MRQTFVRAHNSVVIVQELYHNSHHICKLIYHNILGIWRRTHWSDSAKHFIVSIAIGNWAKVSFRASRWGVVCTNSCLLCIGVQHSVGDPKCLLTAFVVLVLSFACSPHLYTLTVCKVMLAYCRESHRDGMRIDFSMKSSIHVASRCIQASMNVVTMLNPMLGHVCSMLSRCKMSVLDKNCLH